MGQQQAEPTLDGLQKRADKINDLIFARARIKEYLRLKFTMEDWHGVQDAASDLRDIDAELVGLRF